MLQPNSRETIQDFGRFWGGSKDVSFTSKKTSLYTLYKFFMTQLYKTWSDVYVFRSWLANTNENLWYQLKRQHFKVFMSSACWKNMTSKLINKQVFVVSSSLSVILFLNYVSFLGILPTIVWKWCTSLGVIADLLETAIDRKLLIDDDFIISIISDLP